MPETASIRQFVAKVDPFNANERDLFRGHESIPYLQVKYSDSHWLLNNSVDDLLGSNQQLILVDWEDGEKLKDRDPDHVVRRCLMLEPYIDYAWLGDRWTYEKMTPRENRKQINTSVDLQRYLGEQFEQFGVDFEFNPMVLGWKPWHLRRFSDLLEDFENTLVGFDATAYRSKYNQANDVNLTFDVLDLGGMYVNGCIGPTHLRYLPNGVKAFSGKSQILKEVRLDNDEFSRNLLGRSIERRINAFENPQTELGEFNTAAT